MRVSSSSTLPFTSRRLRPPLRRKTILKFFSGSSGTGECCRFFLTSDGARAGAEAGVAVPSGTRAVGAGFADEVNGWLGMPTLRL